MNRNFRTVVFAVVAGLLFALVGCGGSPSSSPISKGGKPLDPQGNWLFTFNENPGTTSANTVVLAGQLFELNPPVVTSNALGSLLGDLQPCPGSYLLNGQVSGTNSISLTLTGDANETTNPPNINVSLTGTIAGDQQHMSGTYSTTVGGCVSGSGTWTAVLLTPVTGNWSGTVSNSTANLSVTASLTENTDQTSPNMGQVTGTVALQGMPCFPSTETLNVLNNSVAVSFHLGETLFIETPADNNGISLQTAGTVDEAATTYNTVAGFQIHGGVCDGQNFNGTLTRQQ